MKYISTFTANEVTIPATPTTGLNIVALWAVKGHPNHYYPTKSVAESVARQLNPDNLNPYSLVYYLEFFTEVD